MSIKRLYITSMAAMLIWLAVAPFSVYSQQLDYRPKILLVTAHPDDDALYSATVFKTTYLLDGVVDLAVMTNGEGGYRYSTLGNYLYGKNLDKEEVGRAWLPGIRKKEVMAGGEIVGIRNYYFLDQVDDQYSEDIAIPLKKWNTDYVTARLQKVIREEEYDFIFTMLPHAGTHAHHKASALLTLRAVINLPRNLRPLVLGTTILRSEEDSTEFRQLKGYPLTEIDRSVGHFTFNRNQRFGHEKRLNYNIISNWVIAEHKSQGTMQLFMGAGVIEEYWYYRINPDDGVTKVREFFKAVNAAE
ncbi:MAG: PIG-L family deacetylase, partial [Balneolaceae bacterium]|nr:PIG-L family deacetylase [Balneolaceae bacterium]